MVYSKSVSERYKFECCFLSRVWLPKNKHLAMFEGYLSKPVPIILLLYFGCKGQEEPQDQI